MPPSSALLLCIATVSMAWGTPLPAAARRSKHRELAGSSSSSSSGHRSLFDEWKTTHNKVYAEAEHEAERLEIFLDNLQLIHKHNADLFGGLRKVVDGNYLLSIVVVFLFLSAATPSTQHKETSNATATATRDDQYICQHDVGVGFFNTISFFPAFANVAARIAS